MLGIKRKYSEFDDDIEEDDDLLNKCFEISLDEKLRDVPTNGYEYLLTVKMERDMLPVISKCKMDYSNLNQQPTFIVEQIPIAKCCESLKPTRDWQDTVVRDFSQLRKHVESLRANKKTHSVPIRQDIACPDTCSKWKDLFSSIHPVISFVVGFPNPMYDVALINIIELLDEIQRGSTIDKRTGLWIYSLLACNGEPFLSQTTSILRDLARKCAEIRSHIDPEDANAGKKVNLLNLIICIVGRHFQQYDIADYKESELGQDYHPPYFLTGELDQQFYSE